MLDMRYHVASLVAVFLALTIGIILGTVFVDERLLSQRQNQLVEDISEDVDRVREENKQLADRIKISDEFQRAVLPLVIQKKMEGKQIAVISAVPVAQSAKNGLKEALAEAGAKVFFVKMTSADFGLERQEIKDRLSSFFPEEDLSNDQLKESIIKQLALALTSTDLAFINELTGLKLLEVEGELAVPVNGAIVLGGLEDKEFLTFFQNSLFLGEQFKTLGLPVAGVEASDAKSSSVPLFQRSGFSTVDNIDMITGQAALILVLEGIQGSYGIKPTAQGLLPKPATP